jgi:hypothetical protein
VSLFCCFRAEREKAYLDTAILIGSREGVFRAAETVRNRVPMLGVLADWPVVAVKVLLHAVGLEPRGRVVRGLFVRSTGHGPGGVA